MFKQNKYTEQQEIDVRLMHMTIFNNLKPDEYSWQGTKFKSKSLKQLLTDEEYRSTQVYFCSSTVNGKPTDKDKSSLSHANDNLIALRTIVLDDIGTKVSKHEINLLPTFIVETSLNNFQYIYVLTDPIYDHHLADRVLLSFKNHNPPIGDPGSFTRGRLTRLPLGINGKGDITDTFRPRLHTTTSQPQTYTLSDILEGLGVTLICKNDTQDNNNKPNNKPTDDPLYNWLKKNHHIPYDHPDEFEGYAKVICPREEEHSNRTSQTIYDAGFSPDGVTQPGRQFKCHHSHNGNPPDTNEFIAYYEALGAPTEPVSGFQLSNGRIIPNLTNCVIALNNLKDTHIWFDLMSQITFINDELIADHHYIKLRTKMHAEFDQVSFGEKTAQHAVEKVARDNEINPVQEYFNNLPEWDNIKRAETIFIDYQLVKDTPVARISTRKWLLAIMSRVYKPGTVFDHAIYLTGNEGTGKTRMLEALAIQRDWFGQLETTDPKLMREQITGCIIVELAEGIIHSKHSKEEVKSMISRDQSKLRLAYGHNASTVPISHVFAGTTNKHDFLKGEQDGMRRIWPLKIGREPNDVYAYEKFIPLIPQIYAEIKTWYDSNETLDIPRELIAAMASNSKSVIEEDEWVDTIVNYLDVPVISKVSTDDTIARRTSIKILSVEALDADYAQFTRGSSNCDRLKGIMNNLPNWQFNGKIAMVMPDGLRAKGWRRIDPNKDSYGNEFEIDSSK